MLFSVAPFANTPDVVCSFRARTRRVRGVHRARPHICPRELACTASTTHRARNFIANMPAAVRTRKRPTNAATTSAKAPPKRKRTRQSQRNANLRDKRRLVDASPSTRSEDTEPQESESDAESPPERRVVAREDKEHQLAVDAEAARAALSASTEQPPSLVAAPPIDEDFAQEHEAAKARIAAIAAQSRPSPRPNSSRTASTRNATRR